jgi:SAM-dependent methyltransferase
MVGSRAYDFVYRYWAPRDSVGVRSELRRVLDEGRVSPTSHHRALDLGCGTGVNVVHLATVGFDSWGVDFSRMALDTARHRAEAAGVDCTLVEGDLTASVMPDLEGSFDFLVDFGTLDDLKGDRRKRMAATIDRLAKPGTVLLEWCFYARRDQLPPFQLLGTLALRPCTRAGRDRSLVREGLADRDGGGGPRPSLCLVLAPSTLIAAAMSPLGCGYAHRHLERQLAQGPAGSG